MIIAIAGQSNAVGGAKVNDITIEAGLDAPYANVTLVQRMAGGVGDDPPIFQDIGPAALAPRDIELGDGSPLAEARMGVELTLGRALDRRWPAAVKIVKFALSGSGLDANWKPTADYPSVGPNICAQFIAWVRQQEAAFGERLGAIVWIQGNSDSNDADEAAAYAANMEALLDAWRSAFPGVVVVFDRLHSGMAGTHNATVRAQQATFAAAHASDGVRMLSTDDLGLRDDSHYTADAFVELGGRFADLLEGLLGGVTWPRIRELQLDLVRQLEPTTLPEMPFRAWEANEVFFGDWAEASGGPFRELHIERMYDDREPRFIAPGLSSVVHSEIVMVSYPRQVDLFGRRLDDIIDQDVADLTRALGLRARADYAALSPGLLGVRRSAAYRQEGQAAVVLAVEFLLEYDRTIP